MLREVNRTRKRPTDSRMNIAHIAYKETYNQKFLFVLQKFKMFFKEFVLQKSLFQKVIFEDDLSRENT